MTSTKSALRVFLKNEAGAVIIDLTMFLGDSIELAMVVTGVASRGAPVAANATCAPEATAPSGSVPELRVVQ